MCKGAGRGLRIAEGKQNCLWIDFSDRRRTAQMQWMAFAAESAVAKSWKAVAPFAVCGECGNQVQPSPVRLNAPDCGATLREPK